MTEAEIKPEFTRVVRTGWLSVLLATLGAVAVVLSLFLFLHLAGCADYRGHVARVCNGESRVVLTTVVNGIAWTLLLGGHITAVTCGVMMLRPRWKPNRWRGVFLCLTALTSLAASLSFITRVSVDWMSISAMVIFTAPISAGIVIACSLVYLAVAHSVQKRTAVPARE